jgi:hypothetical protein
MSDADLRVLALAARLTYGPADRSRRLQTAEPHCLGDRCLRTQLTKMAMGLKR